MDELKTILIEITPILISVLVLPLIYKGWQYINLKVQETETRIDDTIIDLAKNSFGKIKDAIDKDGDGILEVEEISEYIVLKSRGRIKKEFADLAARSIVKGLNK